MFGVLYLQSAYQMLKNSIPLETLIKKVKTGGYDFIALSDENLHGMYQLFKEAPKHQLKPVLGLKVTVQLDLVESGFLIYVKNNKGYENLLKLILLKQDNKLTLSDLATHQEGLMFVTSGQDSEIDRLIKHDLLEEAYGYLLLLKKTLKDFYVGLSLDSFDQEMKIGPTLSKMSDQAKVIVLPIHQTSYLDEAHVEVYEALIKIEDERNEKIKDANYQLMNKEELETLFFDYPLVFSSLSDFINQITFTWNPPIFEMPDYPLSEGTSSQFLRSLAIVGLKKRLKKIENANQKVYQDRLLFELDVIHKMGFDNYFLIVYDFVKYAKTNGILVGPGRGSSAGSLVAYCLGITDVDPITYDLLFERFLNPDRISMPDIDMDFPDDKRDQVLNYVKEKYGKEHMVSIVTFGTFAVRSSIRDIARVMKIDNSRVNGIIARVNNQDIDQTDEEMVRLLKVAEQIEGLPRHTGTHAAGMILAKQDLTRYIPLQKGTNDFYQSQFEQKDLEALGLLKIDFLGIRNLSIIDEVCHLILKENPQFSLIDIPLHDVKTYELLEKSDTSGIFQLESSGMRAVLRKLKPNTFEDIVAILALYRPGPMDNIGEYIERRNGKAFDYLHDDLKPILEKTYGIIVYQEQIMRIAHEFAGYTLAEADILRRGVSKKDKAVLEDERIRFTRQCIKQGYSEKIAIEIYDYIVKFADYGFNRSHSVAYALVAYQMAYLKANYFAIFMTSLLSNVIGNDQTTNEYLNELRKQNIKILSPHIQISTQHYIYQNQSIYLPLLAIKSIGRQTVQKIMDIRKEGPFIDYQDFKLRVKKEINEKNLEMLIHSGALDCFGLNHQTMIANKQIDQAGYELYITDFKMKMQEDYSFREKATFELESLGFYVLYHPMVAYQDTVEKLNLKPLSYLEKNQSADVLAFFISQKIIKTKQGKEMAFIELDDGSSQIEATLFTETYLSYKNDLNNDIKIFKIKANVYKNQRTYVIESMKKV